MVYKCSHSGKVTRVVSKILNWCGVGMYTAIAQMRNINIEASSLLLDTISTEK